MNFLQLCQAVESRIGLQGSGLTSVATTVGVQGDVVKSVYDAWIDIQNFRECQWDWMRATATFSTAASTTNYTKVTIGGLTNRINKFKEDSVYLNDGSNWNRLIFKEYDEFIYDHINDSETVTPKEFTIKRSDGSITFPSPKAIYSISADYWKTAQKLENNTDTPEMPEQWHLIIVYLAVQKLGASIASPSAQMEYAQLMQS